MSVAVERLAVDGNGERLVPGESHDRAEVIRPKSSYEFFRAVITVDRKEIRPCRFGSSISAAAPATVCRC